MGSNNIAWEKNFYWDYGLHYQNVTKLIPLLHKMNTLLHIYGILKIITIDLNDTQFV